MTTASDTDAFNSQLCSHLATLERRAFRYVKTEADAADLVQRTIERALTYRHGFEMGTNMRAWLSTIMHNTYINTWRKRQKHNELLDMVHVEPRSAKAPRPDDRDGVREALQILETLRAGMSEDFFETLRLCDFEGKSYREIADEMQVPDGTVMSRLYRARRRARELLCKSYDTEMLAQMLDVPVERVQA